MSVVYVSIDGEKVSEPWYRVLRAMRADGVQFNVNEGHRTMARQQYFYDLYLAGKGPIAAVPSPNAPHIRTGRIDHAIDFGNDPAVFAWLSRHGLKPARTVRWANGTVREPWHIECPADRLRAFRPPRPKDWFLADDEREKLHVYHHPKDRAQQVRARVWLERRVASLYRLFKAERGDRLHRKERQAYLRDQIKRKGKR